VNGKLTEEPGLTALPTDVYIGECPKAKGEPYGPPFLTKLSVCNYRLRR